jgi:Ring hydroxylating beta subunit
MSLTPEKSQAEAAVQSVEDVRQFLHREARFLNDKDWDNWLVLYAADAEFWVATRDDGDELVTDPQTQILLIWYGAQGRSGGQGFPHQDWAIRCDQHAAGQDVTQHQQCRDPGTGRRPLRAALQLGDV